MTSNYTKMKRAIGRAYKASMDFYNEKGTHDGIEITAYGVKILCSIFTNEHLVNGKVVIGYKELERAVLYALPYRLVRIDEDNTWAKIIYEDETYYHVCYVGDEELPEEYHWNVIKTGKEKIETSEQRKKNKKYDECNTECVIIDF